MSIVTGAPVIPGLTFRPATPADWGAMADVHNRAFKADGVDDVRSGESLADEYRELDETTMPRNVLLAEVDGRTIAFVMGYLVLRDGILTAETRGSVMPDYRRRGIGTAMWHTTRDRLATEAAAEPTPGPREMRAFALDAEAGGRALFDAMGYVSVRFGFEMRRFLTGALPEHALPAGLEMRTAVEPEYRAIFDADVEAFKDHWGHRPKSETDFQTTFFGIEADPSMYLVAWDGDQVAGVVMNAILTEENDALGVRRGWLEHVSVRRPWRGRGVAKALCSASFRLLRERGMDEAWLGVDGTNPHGALQLYQDLGFTVARRWQAYGRPLDRPAPPGWRSGDDPGGGTVAPAAG
jgi:mycothiol synthase